MKFAIAAGAIGGGPVVALGHSAGGHLAVWAAARTRFARWADGVPVAQAVSLAGVLDLTRAHADGLGSGAIIELWKYVITMYSERQIKRKEERLVAISGLAHAFHQALNLRYLAGLWSGPTLPLMLLWEARGDVGPAYEKYIAPTPKRHPRSFFLISHRDSDKHAWRQQARGPQATDSPGSDTAGGSCRHGDGRI